MSPKALFLVLGLVATGLIGFFALQSTPEPKSSGVSAGPSDLTPEEDSDPAELEAGENEAQAKALAQGQPIGQARSSIQGAARSLNVSVIAPEEAQWDSSIRVIAVPAKAAGRGNGREVLDKLASGEKVSFAWTSAAVNQDWSADLELPKTIEEPVILLDGRYVYCLKPSPTEGDASELTLEAEHGACLVVNLVSPLGLQPKGKLRVMGFQMGSGRGNFASRSASLEQREIRGLKGGLTWAIKPDLEEHFSPLKMGIQLEPGKTREVDLDVQLGCSIEGQLTDDRGNHLEGIEVTLTSNMPWMRMLDDGPKAKTDEEGRYILAPVGAGLQTVEAQEKGRVDAKSEDLELLDGETRTGVNLVLSLGETIAGQVLWPDGKPVSKGLVVVETRRSGGGFGPWGGDRRTEAGRSTTDADGKFEVTGLSTGKYSLKASKRSEGSLGDKVNLHGEANAVQGGQTNVKIRLQAPQILRGRVVDQAGQPVTRFTITGRSTKDGGPSEKQKYDDENGRFAFERMAAGSWRIEVQAKGFDQAESVPIDMPYAGSELVLEVLREASIAGLVQNSAGQPVVGARVSASNGESRGGFGGWNRGPSSETNEAGEYLLEGLAPGTWELTAAATGWADSQEAVVELLAGASLEDVSLSLRRGGRIEGVVSSPDGSPLAGRSVSWGDNPMGFGNRGEVRSDSGGRFVLENVTPGDWQVTAAAPMEEIGEKMQNARGSQAFTSMMDGLLTTTCTVVENETTQVFLGGEPMQPVRIYGRVLQNGEPLAKADVYAVSEGSAVFQGMKSVVSAEDGTYTMTVDRPGAYILSARKGAIGVEAPTDVARADEMRVDLVIPGGGLGGIVTLPNGEAAAGIRITLEREDGLGRIRWQGDNDRTDVEGSFGFEGLEKGVYTVRVNTAGWGGSSNADFATVVKGDVAVGDKGQTRVDFRLQKPGTIVGMVLGLGGNPVADTTVFFRDSAGKQISPVSGTRTGPDGRFERKGLAEGNYTLTAKTGESASAESQGVLVRPGQNSEMRLELLGATTLAVTLVDKEDKNARLRVEVFDEEDRELAGMMTIGDMQKAFREGTNSTVRRVGPLTAGKYRVRASTADGRFAEKEVTLTGRSGEKEVRLVLQP